MFRSVLVANRGEIAVRIIRTLRTMGIRPVVVASIPDRRSLAVRSADAWVLLEGYSAAETYLDIDAVIAAAKAEGCEAIHPGYGFLAERADFAEACAKAGVVFIGPPPAVLRAVGDKAAARRLAVANGVPVVPGWDGPDDDDTLVREATHVGFPVMIKARGGGGGRGMREVHDPHALPEAIDSARREAQAAFGDPGLLIEKLVTGAHHVEVQVVADAHGQVIHLGERDCSVQRRHQKLIEESPSPVVDDTLRAELTGAALRLARAIGYVNAGTFEFLVGPRGATNRKRAGNAQGSRPFYFLEVNPRLQVEHPVTEMVTGLDLVELQVRVAAGEPLPLRQEDVRFEGHAIEFRINAEDPWDNFKPGGGRVTLCEDAVERCDTGFERGDVVPTQYDSLLAKAIFHRPDRASAFDAAAEQIPHVIQGNFATNAVLQAALAESASFREGDVTIDWLESHLEAVLEAGRAPIEAWVAAAAALSRPTLELLGGRKWPFPGTRWLGAGPAVLWLNDQTTSRAVIVERAETGHGTATVEGVEVAFHDDGHDVLVGRPSEAFDAVELSDMRTVYGARVTPCIRRGVAGKGRNFVLVPPPPLPRRAPAAEEGATAIVAPLAGTVAMVKVAEGDDVAPGDLLLVLDAMKMEHRITAPAAGRVTTVHVRTGGTVREGDVLVDIG